MPQIGSAVVTGWQGRLLPARLESRMAERIGENGVGVVFDAWRARSQLVTTVVDISASSLFGEVARYRRIVSTTVQVYDQFNTLWDYVLVQDCDLHWDQLATGAYRLTATWSLIVRSLIP